MYMYSTTPYIHPRLNSRIELKFSDCQIKSFPAAMHIIAAGIRPCITVALGISSSMHCFDCNACAAIQYRGSYMSAHVLLNLLNELGKRVKLRGLPSILSLFRNEFNKFNNTRARMLDSIYHMILSKL